MGRALAPDPSPVRYGVLADIHGNLHALEATLRLFEREEVDGYLCAGDLVGYGPFPNECVELVSSLKPLCVMGNHDLMALDRLSEDDCIPLAQTTMRWTRTVLSDASRDYLEGLPPRATLDGVVVAHGSLEDSTYYVATAPEAARELDRLRSQEPHAEVLILGHTHRHAMFEQASGRLRAPGEAGVSLPRERGPFLLNPGSVGQARERRARARCMLLDLDRREATFHAVAYDMSGCLRALRDQGLPPNACHLPPSASQTARRLLRHSRDVVLGSRR